MISFTDFLVLAGFFLLRVGVPVLVIAGFGYLLKRLDRRWEAEARIQRAAEATQQPAQQPALPRPAERPATPKRLPMPSPTPSLPFILPPAMGQGRTQQMAQPGMAAAQSAAYCWDVKKCSESQRAGCAAPQHPELPCWQARFDAEGQIAEDCVNCDVFQRYPRM